MHFREDLVQGLDPLSQNLDSRLEAGEVGHHCTHARAISAQHWLPNAMTPELAPWCSSHVP